MTDEIGKGALEAARKLVAAAEQYHAAKTNADRWTASKAISDLVVDDWLMVDIATALLSSPGRAGDEPPSVRRGVEEDRATLRNVVRTMAGVLSDAQVAITYLCHCPGAEGRGLKPPRADIQHAITMAIADAVTACPDLHGTVRTKMYEDGTHGG